MEKKYILALDQGTTSTRAILFDRDKEIVGLSQREFTQIYPKNGWIEHDPLEIWDTVQEVLKGVLKESGVKATQVEAIGITNQRETTVVWERSTGRPIYPAIVWLDRRTAERCRELKDQGLEKMFKERTGLVLDPYFSGTKVEWILDQVQGARGSAEAGELCFGTIDSWLLYKLTEGRVHRTDRTNASRTLLYDIHRLEWDQELCGVLGVPSAMLPEVLESAGEFGETLLDGVKVPIRAMVGDQQGALFGQGCFLEGEAKVTYGTGCFLLVHTGDRAVSSDQGLLTTIGISQGGSVAYALEGSVFSGGSLLKWLRDELGVFRENGEIEGLASSVEDSMGVYIVPAFSGLGAPWWEPAARGTVFGLTRSVGKGALVRAALEAIAYQVRDLCIGVEEELGHPLRVLKADGGVSASSLMLEFQSAITERIVVRPACLESTALGAAGLAGIQGGFWKDRLDFLERGKEPTFFKGTLEKGVRESMLAGWKRAVDSVIFWAKR